MVDLLARQESAYVLPPRPPQAYLEENEAAQMLAALGSVFALAMLCVLARVYVRVAMLKTFGIDDWMMVFTATLSTACFACFVALTEHGVGHHAEYYSFVHPEYMTVFFKVVWWYSWIIVVAYSSVKISIACFLLRLADHRKLWRIVLYVVMGVLVAFTVGSVLSIILQCLPVEAAWDFALRAPPVNAKCFTTDTFRSVGVFNSTFNLATDLLLALLPVPMVWKLQTNIQTKISLMIILGLGLFASGIAVYKIPLQYHFFEETDFSGHGAWYYIWQQAELNVGIIAACLPTLRPLASNFFGAVSALTSGERYGTGRATGASRPYISNGYLKQNESTPGHSANQSYVMGKVSKGRPLQTDPDSPIEEEFKEGKGVVAYATHGRVRKGSRGAESDESILALHKGIMRTTEVNVS